MPESQSSRLTRDEAYDLLSNPRRRFVVSYLRDRQRPVELSELATAVAAWENGLSESELTDQQEKRVYVSLYQTHIPKLSDVDIVEYDQDSGRVSISDAVSRLDRFLPETENRSPPWPWHVIYGGTALLAGLFYLFVRVATSGASETLAGLVVVGSFLAVALAQLHYSKRPRRRNGRTNEEYSSRREHR